MFKRVIFSDWQPIITITAFFILFTVFLYFSWKAIRMNEKERNHMADLPLESDRSNPDQN